MGFYLIMGVGLLGAATHIYFDRKTRDRGQVVEILLRYLLLSLVGLNGLYAFLGHFFIPDEIAHYIGWPPGSPFQREVAFANLAFGTLGVLCFWIRGKFWLAVIIGYSILLWGAAYGHILDIIQHHNYAPGNAGLVLYMDIIYPMLLITLYVDYCLHRRKEEPKETQAPPPLEVPNRSLP